MYYAEYMMLLGLIKEFNVSVKTQTAIDRNGSFELPIIFPKLDDIVPANLYNVYPVRQLVVLDVEFRGFDRVLINICKKYCNNP